MSARPGYDELVEQRGREVADRIIDSAEWFSDAGHLEWPDALARAIEEHDRTPDPALTAQQAENARLYHEMSARRGDDARPILYLVNELGGDALDHPRRLALAEELFDAEGWRLGSNPSMRDQLDWAAEVSRRRSP